MLATGGAALAAGAGLYASGKAAHTLANGFGLAGSATALDASAVALDAAAVRLGVAGEASAAEHAADKYLAGGASGGATSLGSTAATAAGVPFAVAGGVLAAGVLGSAAIAYGHHGEKAKPYQGFDEMFPKAEDEMATTSGGISLTEGDSKRQFGPWKPITKRMNMGGNSHARSLHPADPPRVDPSLTRVPGRFDPPPRLDLMGSGKGLQPPAPPQKVDVIVSPPAPMKMTWEVVPSSALLQIVEQVKTAALQFKAHHKTGPGGLGETDTGQN